MENMENHEKILKVIDEYIDCLKVLEVPFVMQYKLNENQITKEQYNDAIKKYEKFMRLEKFFDNIVDVQDLLLFLLENYASTKLIASRLMKKLENENIGLHFLEEDEHLQNELKKLEELMEPYKNKLFKRMFKSKEN